MTKRGLEPKLYPHVGPAFGKRKDEAEKRMNGQVKFGVFGEDGGPVSARERVPWPVVGGLG